MYMFTQVTLYVVGAVTMQNMTAKVSTSWLCTLWYAAGLKIATFSLHMYVVRCQLCTWAYLKVFIVNGLKIIAAVCYMHDNIYNWNNKDCL